MEKFVIQPHGRLNDWVADEKGYFRGEGLDYIINVQGSRRNTPEHPGVRSPGPAPESLFGAFERYEEGHGRKGRGSGDVSCACHWTVNQAANIDKGIMWGRAYSMCEAAIVVPPESPASNPTHLKGIEIAVGYHSGSHFSAIQAMEVFLSRNDITLKFVGSSWSRVDIALARKVPAVNVWGPQLYLLEQQGFRRLASTTFMMAFLFPPGVDIRNVECYMNGLIKAQSDIDVEPELYKHYYMKEIPDRFHETVDVRQFGIGERVVSQPYTKKVFEKTQKWLRERELFANVQNNVIHYESAVVK